MIDANDFEVAAAAMYWIKFNFGSTEPFWTICSELSLGEEFVVAIVVVVVVVVVDVVVVVNVDEADFDWLISNNFDFMNS